MKHHLVTELRRHIVALQDLVAPVVMEWVGGKNAFLRTLGGLEELVQLAIDVTESEDLNSAFYEEVLADFNDLADLDEPVHGPLKRISKFVEDEVIPALLSD